MTYVREHELATTHPLAKAAAKKADRKIAAARKAMIRKAAALRDKAEAKIEQACSLEYDARKHAEYGTPFAEMRAEIEDAGYWAARVAIGDLPRDADGNYLTPAPEWSVTYQGAFIGTYQGEESADVLRIVCPPMSDKRRWSDFDVARVSP